MSDEKCYACDRKLGKSPTLVRCEDEQTVFVGRECLKLIKAAGTAGYQPPKGGPRLYLMDTPGLKQYWPELSPTPSPEPSSSDMLQGQEDREMPKMPPMQQAPDIQVRVTNGTVQVITGRRRLMAQLEVQDQARALDVVRSCVVSISKGADGGLVATDVPVTH